MLGEEAESIFTHLKDESPIGIRVNPIKTNRNDFLAIDYLEEFSELSPSNPQWVNGDQNLAGARRAWPHRIKGYGHFIARLRDQRQAVKPLRIPVETNLPPQDFDIWQTTTPLTGHFYEKKGKLYFCPPELPKLAHEKLRSPLPGFYLGELKKTGFNPATLWH